MDDDGSSIRDLVCAAGEGEQTAWQEIVERYSPLLISVIRRFRLNAAQTEDVAQTVWLRLVEHLDGLRDPQALPKWLITTARHECLRYLTVDGRAVPHDPLAPSWPELGPPGREPDEELLQAERHQALLAGLAELPKHHRDLLILLVEDPPPSYADVSRRLGMPVGSIGPTRARALERLRATAPIRSYAASLAPLHREGGESRDPAKLA